MGKMLDTLKREFKEFGINEKELYKIIETYEVSVIEIHHNNGKVSKLFLELSCP